MKPCPDWLSARFSTCAPELDNLDEVLGAPKQYYGSSIGIQRLWCSTSQVSACSGISSLQMIQAWSGPISCYWGTLSISLGDTGGLYSVAALLSCIVRVAGLLYTLIQLGRIGEYHEVVHEFSCASLREFRCCCGPGSYGIIAHPNGQQKRMKYQTEN